MGQSYNVFRVKTVDSTNTVAKNGYAKGLYNSGAVIVADSQMEGRGQLRTKWHDESGKNLLMTLILEPYKLPARSFFRLNEAVSLALTDVLPGEYLPKIKWPNDIFWMD